MSGLTSFVLLIVKHMAAFRRRISTSPIRSMFRLNSLDFRENEKELTSSQPTASIRPTVAGSVLKIFIPGLVGRSILEVLTGTLERTPGRGALSRISVGWDFSHGRLDTGHSAILPLCFSSIVR